MSKTLVAGFFVGGVLAVGALVAVSRVSTHIVFESDETRTLGLQFESAPKVALRPLTVAEIAERLGLQSKAAARAQAAVLSDRIRQGYLPSGWGERCGHEYSESLCQVMSDYFEKQILGAPTKAGGKRKSLPFDAKKLSVLQKEDYSTLVSRMPDWTSGQMKRFAVMSLASQECPRNFSLALGQKLEIHLDLGLENLKLIEALMDHGFACLSGNEPWYEFLTTRRALWAVVQQNFDESLVYFDKALAAKEIKEDYRTMFWKAYALEQLDRGNEAIDLRKRIAEKYPTSWFSILSQTKRGIDPLAQILRNPIVTDEYSSGDEIVDRRGLWLQLLLELDHASEAVKKYSEFFVRALDTDLKPGFVQYVARSLDRSGFHRLQILLLNKQNLAHPVQLNRETLRLMFPKPFFEELDRHSVYLDTALLLGLARQESGFDPSAQSVADARGLLQILPSTARGIQRRFNKDDLFDYAKNIEIGARFVLSLIRSFDGSVEKALASYNAGPGNMRRWERRYGASEAIGPQLLIDLIPFKETRDYVSSIMRNAYWYHRLFPELTQALDGKTVTTSLTLESLLFKDGDQRQNLRFPASRAPTQSADPSLNK